MSRLESAFGRFSLAWCPPTLICLWLFFFQHLNCTFESIFWRLPLAVSKRAPVLGRFYAVVPYFTFILQITANGSIFAFDLPAGFTGLWQTAEYLSWSHKKKKKKRLGKAGRQKLEVRSLWLSLCSQMCTLIWNRVLFLKMFKCLAWYWLFFFSNCSFCKMWLMAVVVVYCGVLESLGASEPEKQRNWLENIAEAECKYEQNDVLNDYVFLNLHKGM